MKHNPKKCAFGVSSGKFLGFLVSQRGIKINPDKIKAIEDTTDQLSVKEVQRLTWRLAALNRFIFRSSKKCHHFFSLLKKKNNYEWTLKYQQALKDLKRYLSSPPLLSKPEEGEADLLSDLGGSDADSYYKVNATNLVWDWRNENIDYSEHEKLHEDPKTSQELHTKAARYSFKGGQLYRRSFQGMLARCLGASEANYVM
nr:uncharacterized protein LOC104086223 [Nicotiana tomentosiformis]